MQEQEYNQKLLKSTHDVPEKIEINGALRIPCHHYPQCNTGRFQIIKLAVWIISSEIHKTF